MRRILLAAFFSCFLLLGQYSRAQSVCFEAGPILVQTPGGNNCAMVAQQTAGATAGVVADLSFGSIGNFQNLTYTGQLYGDLGQPVNDGTAATTQGCQVGGALHVNTIYSPGVHTVYAQFVRCGQYGPAYYNAQVMVVVLPPDPTTTPVCTPTLIDPVKSMILQGAAITTNRTDIVKPTTVFAQGVAADGVTQTVVAVVTNNIGDQIQLNLINDANSPSSSSDQDGGLAPIGGSLSNLANNVSLVADTTTYLGPTAFAIYRAPTNFARGTQNFPQDNTAVQRQVTLQAFCPATNGSVSNNPTGVPLKILRPPIVLVHGIWSSQGAWDSFAPAPNSAEYQLWSSFVPNASLWRADYSAMVPVGSTVPAYNNLQQVKGSALGYQFNAPIALTQIRKAVSSFASIFGVAAVQADVVAHSMGGVITRTMAVPNQPWNFLSNDTYGSGPVEKLITIATPHLGTPLALKIVQPNNLCVAGWFKWANLVALQTATVSGSTVNGAVGDLQGDGQGGTMSSPLQNLQANQSSQPFPMAFVAGSEAAANLSGLDTSPTSFALRNALCGSSPLAQQVTSQNWPTVFTPQASDGIVPLKSQLNDPLGTSSIVPFSGVIHSSDLSRLGFTGPAELEYGTLVGWVVDLLNEPKSGFDYQH